MTNSLISIFTAVLGFSIALLIKNNLLPLLKRLKFISDGTASGLSDGSEIPTGGGVMAAAGMFISAALGYTAMRFFSDSIDLSGSDDSLYFAGQIVILAAFAAGFYGDLLKSRGKKDGLSPRAEIGCIVILSAAFVIIRMVIYPADTDITVPFAGTFAAGGAYIILAIAVMTAVSAGMSRFGEVTAEFSSQTAVFAAGAAAVFSKLSPHSFKILSFAAAGSFAALLFVNYPRTSVQAGQSGRLAAAMTLAVLTVSARGAEICLLISSVPLLTYNVSVFLRKKGILKPKAKCIDAKAIGSRTAARFAYSAVWTLIGIGIFYASSAIKYPS